MTSKEIISFLESRGYKSYPVSALAGETCVWNGEKRTTSSRECECNNKPPAWHVQVYDYWFANRQNQSVQFELFGEYKDLWYTLKCYGLSFDECVQKIDQAEQSLLKAWEAL